MEKWKSGREAERAGRTGLRADGLWKVREGGVPGVWPGN